jgi:hypothetical protein
MWHDTADDSYSNPQSFGNAELAGLVGWWKFDETTGTIAADSSGAHHDGTLVGNAKWAPGRFGGAIDLDGNDSCVRIADKSAFDLGGDITVACWANLRSVPTNWMAMVAKGDTAWRLSTVENEDKFHFAVNDFNRGADQVCVSGTTTVTLGSWHSVVGTYTGSTLSLYVDGKLEATQSWSEGLGHDDFDLLIGDNAEMKGRSFNGLIDDVRIFNYALSESEIKALAAGQ